MSTSLAKFLSYVLHPGLIPGVLLAILYFQVPYMVNLQGVKWPFKLVIIGFVLAYTALFPGIFILWLYRKKSINSIHLNQLSDRHLPYLFGIISTSFLVYFLFSKGGLQSSAIVVGVFLAGLILVSIISYFWQISAHASAIAGMLGLLLGIIIFTGESNLHLPFLISILLAGFLAAARLKLDAHTPLQIIMGTFVGLSCGIIGSFFL